MNPNTGTHTAWKKATKSGGNGGSCMEFRHNLTTGMVEVRDSKDPHGPVLTFRHDEIDAARDGFIKGEFDEFA